MKRRELVEARQAERTRRELHAWDFWLGVQDATRMGALRFSAAQDSDPPLFLANEALVAPPLTQLGELQQVALELTRKKQDDLTLLQQCLRVLVAPGASLGGARDAAAQSGARLRHRSRTGPARHPCAGWESKSRQFGLSAEDRAELEDAFATAVK